MGLRKPKHRNFGSHPSVGFVSQAILQSPLYIYAVAKVEVAAMTGDCPDDLERREYEVEFAEAQLVFVNLAAKWEITGQREYALMRELDAAEKRLISLFCNGWGPRLVMTKALSAYRQRLLCRTNRVV